MKEPTQTAMQKDLVKIAILSKENQQLHNQLNDLEGRSNVYEVFVSAAYDKVAHMNACPFCDWSLPIHSPGCILYMAYMTVKHGTLYSA